MYQPTGGEGGELIVKSKINELYRDYNVNINKFDDNKMNSNDNLFELKFIGKNGDNKGKIYYKMFNNNDLNDIKNKSGIPNIKNDQLSQTILYCLSKNNNKHHVKYNLNNNNNNNELKISIEYNAGFLSFNIVFVIQGKLSDIDIIKNELKKMAGIVAETKKGLNAKAIEINELKHQLNEMKTNKEIKNNTIAILKKELNETKNELSKLKTNSNNEIIRLKEGLYKNKIQLKTFTLKFESSLNDVLNHVNVKESKQDYNNNNNSNNNNELCPRELNKHPSKWSANDVKIWIKTLNQYQQSLKGCEMILNKGLNGLELLSLDQRVLHNAIYREFTSWLPNTKHKQPLKNSHNNIRWDKATFKNGETIKVWSIHTKQYHNAHVIEIMNNGIIINWFGYNSEHEFSIFKIQYKNKIHPDCIRMN